MVSEDERLTALTKTLAFFGTIAWLVLALGVATNALAQSSIDECEKIQAADAYNQCLAKFGPPMKSGNLEPERPGDIKSSSAEAAATSGSKAPRGKSHASGRRRGHGTYAHRSRGGHAGHGGSRKRMTISVGK